MQSPEFRDGYDLAFLRWFEDPWCLDNSAPMKGASGIGGNLEIGFEHSSEMSFIVDNDMIQTVSPYRTDDPFAGEIFLFMRYRSPVDLLTNIPSFLSSPMIRGVSCVGLA